MAKVLHSHETINSVRKHKDIKLMKTDNKRIYQALESITQQSIFLKIYWQFKCTKQL